MAGSYPDAPALRIPYERDGSIGFTVSDLGAVATLDNAVLQTWNDEDSDIGSIGNGSNVWRWGLLFPRPMNILGILSYKEALTNVTTSVDTTNGQDGTWVAQGSIAGRTSIAPDYRSNISAVSWNGIKAFRMERNNPWYEWGEAMLHVYGEIAGGSADRLRIWHPTLDQEIGAAHFDWADIPRGTSADKQFRVKNNSAVQTANVINVSIDAPSDTTPSVAGQHTLEKASSPGFAATVQIPTLAPGAISEIITVRRVTPSNATLALWVARILATATSWT